MKQSLEPTGESTLELTVKRSRFIAHAQPVSDRAAAEAAIRAVREAHADASHVVYAYLTGAEASEQAGLSDAGEPHGTAGRPVMDVLRGSGIRDVVVTVVRYFGGTRLGTGGLVHAYGDAARAALHRIPTRPRISRVTADCTVPYDALEPVRRAIDAAGGRVTEQQFGSEVTVTVEVPEAAFEELERSVADLTRGQGALTSRPVGQPTE